ncbi:acylphosphatase [Picrophilus oshimae]|uniref:Acylphosphatase n=2 Tax=Picrophilus torridus (strain ATCC 700027 / DSM 9790 / JCM 10055 / NBRC 100828 / KAW 2/3) TaxID=1122961 RepID=ACYP_PICTO|nr:acylphosphatase [Picrophilus oshimae]Q6L2I0.1 RecName: Full=Acylphosphatase; AltName: Full=Acylphosphate phosphohydrolase [Picrophilus oshimae DSM 9789]AAT42822.1 acylphosphatase [Picrophilus oshimae DSM 9789]SMD31582.1 acylphosphatase [Picrophilus oshimae DSM 9789]
MYIFHGRVQGIGLRARTYSMAKSLGLSGYIKNRDDGTVEAVFQGDEEKIKRIIEYIKGIAYIEKIDYFDDDVKYNDFQIRY